MFIHFTENMLDMIYNFAFIESLDIDLIWRSLDRAESVLNAI